jgi:transposase InsO family protein
MGWKEQRVMGLKIDFVERASKPDANMSALCREFGVSRQTGHKWLRRFRVHGYDGLEEKSRRPKAAPLATAEDVVVAILGTRRKHASWGPRKIFTLLQRQLGDDAPSERTIARVLERFAQIRKRRSQRPLNVIERAPVVSAKASNDIWTIDFKGWWRALDGDRCEPLTVRDAFSRFILAIELIPARGPNVRRILEVLFKRYGKPKAIQCDNGSPFISSRARGGLSELSAWWVSLGIRIVRSRRGKPQDNGGHERMHKDMATDLERDPEASRKAQQRACARWRQEFNHVRPHDALKRKTPNEVYKPTKLPAVKRAPVYPAGFIVRHVNRTGSVRFSKTDTFISASLKGQHVGLQHVSGLRYRVWFYELDLGLVEIEPSKAQLERMSAIVDDLAA